MELCCFGVLATPSGLIQLMQQAVKIRCQRMICSVLSMSHLLHGPPLGLCDDLLWVLPAGMKCCERCYLCCQHCSLWSWCWWGDRTRWITGLQCCCCDYGLCVSVWLLHKKLMLAGGETRWITGLQCCCCDYGLCICAVVTQKGRCWMRLRQDKMDHWVAVLLLWLQFVYLCGCDKTRGSHGAVLCVSFN